MLEALQTTLPSAEGNANVGEVGDQLASWIKGAGSIHDVLQTSGCTPEELRGQIVEQLAALSRPEGRSRDIGDAHKRNLLGIVSDLRLVRQHSIENSDVAGQDFFDSLLCDLLLEDYSKLDELINPDTPTYLQHATTFMLVGMPNEGVVERLDAVRSDLGIDWQMRLSSKKTIQRRASGQMAEQWGPQLGIATEVTSAAIRLEQNPDIDDRSFKERLLREERVQLLIEKTGLSLEEFENYLYAELFNWDGGQGGHPREDGENTIAFMSDWKQQVTRRVAIVTEVASFLGADKMRQLTESFGITIFSRFAGSQELLDTREGALIHQLEGQLEQFNEGRITSDRIVFFPRSDFNGGFQYVPVNSIDEKDGSPITTGPFPIYCEIGGASHIQPRLEKLAKKTIVPTRIAIYLAGHGTPQSIDVGLPQKKFIGRVFRGKNLHDIFPGKDFWLYAMACSAGRGMNVGTADETWSNNVLQELADEFGCPVTGQTQEGHMAVEQIHEIGDAPPDVRAQMETSRFTQSERKRKVLKWLGLGAFSGLAGGSGSNRAQFEPMDEGEYTLPPLGSSTRGAVVTLFPREGSSGLSSLMYSEKTKRAA